MTHWFLVMVCTGDRFYNQWFSGVIVQKLVMVRIVTTVVLDHARTKYSDRLLEVEQMEIFGASPTFGV